MTKDRTKPVAATGYWMRCEHCEGAGLYTDTSFDPPRRFECPWCHGKGRYIISARRSNEDDPRGRFTGPG